MHIHLRPCVQGEHTSYILTTGWQFQITMNLFGSIVIEDQRVFLNNYTFNIVIHCEKKIKFINQMSPQETNTVHGSIQQLGNYGMRYIKYKMLVLL